MCGVGDTDVDMSFAIESGELSDVLRFCDSSTRNGAMHPVAVSAARAHLHRPNQHATAVRAPNLHLGYRKFYGYAIQIVHVQQGVLRGTCCNVLQLRAHQSMRALSYELLQYCWLL
eukprot:IDg19598t1